MDKHCTYSGTIDPIMDIRHFIVKLVSDLLKIPLCNLGGQCEEDSRSRKNVGWYKHF